MAALFRQTARLARRNVFYLSGRTFSDGAKKTDDTYTYTDTQVRTSVEGFYAELSGKKSQELLGDDDIKKELGDLTGDHRVEVLEKLRGSKNPFDVNIQKQDASAGQFHTPIIVPATGGERLVGCVCEEDTTDVYWMMIYSGMKQKCMCGNWFHCVDIPGAHDH